MKKILLIIVLLASFGTVNARAEMDALWDRANSLYTAGDYASAAAVYDSINKTGYESAKLYYNLGNAYFKDNKIGPAILNYNKAQKLAPSDGDIDYNLRVANTFVKDRIEVVPEFFLKKWIRGFMNITGSNGWAVLSLLFLAAALAFTAVYLLGRRLAVRKAGFYAGIVLAALFVFALTFASVQRGRIVNPDEAVIMSSAAPVKSSPDNNSKDIFVLHEGTKVRVTGSLGDWREIMIADGNKGWVNSSSIELID